MSVKNSAGCNSDCAECPAHERSLFSLLAPSERVGLAQEKTVRDFQQRDYLFRSGDAVHGIFCIAAGAVKVSQPQGERLVALRFSAAGDWVGHRSIFTSETYRGTAQAKARVRACFVPTSTIQRIFAGNPAFANQLVRNMVHDLEAAERRLIQDRERNVPTRVISLLRTLDRQFGATVGDARRLSIKLSKVEIAELVGASQEVISRQFSKWKKAELLWEDGKLLYLSNRLLTRLTR